MKALPQRIFSLFCIICVLIAIFPAQSSVLAADTGPAAIEAADLRSASGDFMLRDLSWGSSLEDTGPALYTDFFAEPLSTDPSWSLLRARESFMFLGHEAKVTAGFLNNQLVLLSFFTMLSGDEEDNYDTLCGILQKAFGDASLKSDTSVPSQIWINESEQKTSLQISRYSLPSVQATGAQVILSADANTASFHPVSVEAADFLAEDGTYQFKNLSWGASYDKVAETLGIRFFGTPSIKTDDLIFHHSFDLITVLGYPAEVTAEYYHDAIDLLSFTLSASPKDLDSIFKAVVSQFNTLFGEGNMSETEAKICRWNDSKDGITFLAVSCTDSLVQIHVGYNYSMQPTAANVK